MKAAVGALLFAGLTLVPQQISAQQRATSAQVDAILGPLSSANAPGCAVGISRGGEALIERSYGMADLDHDVPITNDTIFDIGSVSKQFAAAAILLLAQEGKLSLHDDVRKFIPELPKYGRVMTIDHLLTHTSGLRDWGSLEGVAGWYRMIRVTDMADVLDLASRQRSLNNLPGDEYSYSSTGYTLLAIIVQRASGLSLADYSKASIFTPLGMSHTQWRVNFRDVVKGRALAYEKGSSGYEQMVPEENAYGNGGLLTTTGDLLKWNKALDDGRLGRSFTDEMQRRSKLNDGFEIPYARGLFVQERHGNREIFHDGRSGGYTAYSGRFPDQSVAVVVLCNGSQNPTALAHQLADIMLPGANSVHAATDVSIADRSAILRGRAGTYADSRYGGTVVLVENKDGRLATRSGSVLTPLPGGRFRFGNGEIKFRDSEAFDFVSPEGDRMRYTRVAAVSPTIKQLTSLAGTYFSDEALASYVIALEKDRLTYTILGRPQVHQSLNPVYRDVFEDDDGNVFRFHRNSSGQVIAFSHGDERLWDLQFRRVASHPPVRSAH